MVLSSPGWQDSLVQVTIVVVVQEVFPYGGVVMVAAGVVEQGTSVVMVASSPGLQVSLVQVTIVVVVQEVFP